jgi:multiple sugar transport system permease protein
MIMVWKRAATYVAFVLIGSVMVFPFYWMLSTSFMTPVELSQSPPLWWPHIFTFTAYQTVFSVIPFAHAIFNTFVVATAATAGIVATSAGAGYVFAKYQFAGRDTIFFLVLLTIMIPSSVILVPLYYMMNELGLVNTLAALILPNLSTAFGIFLVRQFAFGIPDELLEAARSDGASEWHVFFRIALPMLRPAIASLTVFAFTFQWNRFLWPLTVVHTANVDTVSLALNGLRSYSSSVQFTNVVMAGAAISIIPSVLVFAFLQRYLAEGIATTGVKG